MTVIIGKFTAYVPKSCLIAKRKSIPLVCFSSLAAGTGFEPVQSESQSLVLPLHHPAIFNLVRGTRLELAR